MSVYASPPGVKMAYDVDGSAGFVNVGTLRSLTQGELNTLNAESGTAVSRSGDNTGSTLGIIFPALRDVVAVNHGLSFGGNTAGQSKVFDTSADSTNGADGVWTSRTASMVLSTNYRTGYTTYSLTGIKAVRWNIVTGQSFASVAFGMMHIYQAAPTADTADRLRLWHPTLNQEIDATYFDFGDVQRSTVTTKQFRVKNNSATLTANAIVVSTTAFTDASPTVLSQMGIDNAGSGYSSSQNIGNLAPGVISGIQTLKLTTLTTTALSLWRQRLRAVAGSWT